VIPQHDKDAFLDFLRIGKSPPEAAALVSEAYTASMFRRLLSEKSTDYDPFFAAEYLRARAEGRKNAPPRPDAGKPRTTTLSGHVKADYLTPEMLEQFCEYIEAGVPMKDAAELLEPKTTLTQLHRRAQKDTEFAEQYGEAKKVGYPNFQEGLRSTIQRMADSGDYRAARDLAIIHLPEFREAFLTKKTEIMGGTSNELKVLVQQVFPELSDNDLDMLIDHVEQRVIEPGEDDDARAA
jgi:DNA-directed RNA polymerase subunit F